MAFGQPAQPFNGQPNRASMLRAMASRQSAPQADGDFNVGTAAPGGAPGPVAAPVAAPPAPPVARPSAPRSIAAAPRRMGRGVRSPKMPGY